jgi:hypothetical protein
MKKKGRKVVDQTIADASKIVVVWKDNPKFSLGEDVALKDFQQAITDLESADADFVSRDTELTAAKNQRKSGVNAVRALVTRARSGFRSQFGPDSTQYQQSGGTRLSDRKKPSQKNGKAPNGNANN